MECSFQIAAYGQGFGQVADVRVPSDDAYRLIYNRKFVICIVIWFYSSAGANVQLNNQLHGLLVRPAGPKLNVVRLYYFSCIR